MGSLVENYVHFVWSTWDRRPLVTMEIEDELHRVIGAICVQENCLPLAIGGTDDHVHVLSRVHPTVSVARLAGVLKGVSSSAVNNDLAPGTGFRWQGGYAAFSVRSDDLEALTNYIRNQRAHHAVHTLNPRLEPMPDS
jgi:REP element-mobilizing transposase RayT